MPIYEYVCQNCGKVIELLQSVGQENAGQNCPSCGSGNLAKKISAANIGKAGRGHGHGHDHGESGLCCGRSERPASCGPGGCCGGHH